MLTPRKSKEFKKNYKLMKSRGRNMAKIDAVMMLIMTETPPPRDYKNHRLHGEYEGSFECHIEPDWVLIYKTDPSQGKVTFFCTGTHSDLF
ncbi:MAG: RelE/StbE family addiction module toxin [Treponematales bacterium]